MASKSYKLMSEQIACKQAGSLRFYRENLENSGYVFSLVKCVKYFEVFPVHSCASKLILVVFLGGEKLQTKTGWSLFKVFLV